MTRTAQIACAMVALEMNGCRHECSDAEALREATTQAFGSGGAKRMWQEFVRVVAADSTWGWFWGYNGGDQIRPIDIDWEYRRTS